MSFASKPVVIRRILHSTWVIWIFTTIPRPQFMSPLLFPRKQIHCCLRCCHFVVSYVYLYSFLSAKKNVSTYFLLLDTFQETQLITFASQGMRCRLLVCLNREGLRRFTSLSWWYLKTLKVENDPKWEQMCQSHGRRLAQHPSVCVFLNMILLLHNKQLKLISFNHSRLKQPGIVSAFLSNEQYNY